MLTYTVEVGVGMLRHLHALEIAEQAMFFRMLGQPGQVPEILIEAGIAVDEGVDEVVNEAAVVALLSRLRFAALGMHVVIVTEDTS